MDEGVWRRALECHSKRLFGCRARQGRVTCVWQARRKITTVDAHRASFQHPWATTASPAPLRESVLGNNRMAAHREKQPCCASSESLSSGDVANSNPRCWTRWQVGTLQLDSAEIQLSHQCKLASFYLSTKHQTNKSPMILLLRVAFQLPSWVHPLLCCLWVFPALFSLFPCLARCCAGCQHLESYKETKG